MTDVQITRKPESAQADSFFQAEAQCGCGCGHSGTSAEPAAVEQCGCQAPAPDLSCGDAVGEVPARALTSKELRTSSYIIYVDLPHRDGDMLIVHGYTGAFDKVSKRIATFLRAKEDRRAPRPLYGSWTADPIVEAVPEIPETYQRILLQRGYLTYLTREEELQRFTMFADDLKAQASAPSYVLMPTYNCNLRCFYCFQDHMRTKPEFSYLLKRMTHPMVDRIFDAMPQIEALHGFAPEDGFVRPVSLFGGEPLLRENRDLIDHILQRAKQGGTQTCAVVTNGTDLDAYEDILGPAGLTPLQITLDGIPEEHDKRRVYADGQGSFDRIIKNITLALDRDASVQVRMNIDRRNVDQLPPLAQIFVEQGWDDRPGFTAYATVISPSNDNVDRDTTYSSWELDQEIARLQAEHPVMRAIEPKDNTIRSRAMSIFGGASAGLQASFCSAHSGMYVIDRFGDLYACWERTGNPKIRIGTITPDCTIEMDETTSALWRGRAVTSNPVCRQCRYALYCGGGCAVLAEGRKGRMDANYCDGYAFRFRAMVAEGYEDFVAGKVSSKPQTSAGVSVMEL